MLGLGPGGRLPHAGDTYVIKVGHLQPVRAPTKNATPRSGLSVAAALEPGTGLLRLDFEPTVGATFPAADLPTYDPPLPNAVQGLKRAVIPSSARKEAELLGIPEQYVPEFLLVGGQLLGGVLPEAT